MKNYRLYLVRHGVTQGNLDGIYMGSGTDQPLCAQGAAQLRALAARFPYPKAETVFSSPMRRAVETVELLFPDAKDKIILADLRENAFGEFEGRKVTELVQDAHFKQWMDPAQHYISNLAGAAAPYRYSGCVRRGILNAKYQGKPWRAVEMGNRLVQLAFGGELTVQYGELLPQPVPWAAIGYDLIVPVPASGKRRGYNVPELMALPLAKAMEVPLAPQALERTRAKRHQAGLPLEQRIANVAGAFRAAQPQQLEGKRIRAQEPELVEGKRVLLVDDVITTGTTAAACAQALLHAGADSVFALAFATVEFGAPPDDTTPIHEDDEEDVYRDF